MSIPPELRRKPEPHRWAKEIAHFNSGGMIQYQGETGAWVDWLGPHPPSWDYPRAVFRCKPDEPTSKPWTFDTRPREEEVWVYPVNGVGYHQITGWMYEGAHVSGVGWVDYLALFERWRQENGDRCGDYTQ